MSTPKLYLCGPASLLEADSGFTDDGVAIEARARTRPILPAGIGGDAIFYAVHLALTFDTPFELHITPVVDGVPLWDELVKIGNSEVPDRLVTIWYQFDLTVPILDGEVEVARTGMKGTSFALDFMMPCAPDERVGDLFFEAIEIEYDIMNAGRAA